MAEALHDATVKVARALKANGEHSREHRQAEETRRRIERRLNAAQSEEAKRERQRNMTPAEIVDESMR